MSGGVSGTPVPPGTLFNDRYEVTDEIGRGGMGIVYLGRDTRLHRQVAIKVLPEAFSTDDEIIARFGREARAMAALDHPNVVPVYDSGRQGNFNYFVMKYLEGETVADRLEEMREGRAKPYAPLEVRDIVAQVCQGLAHAHRKGMVHRDIKPGNIMVSPDGHVTIMDFGIVKAPMGGETLTKTGIVFGTPEYMAPEQAQGQVPPSPAADLYSLAVVAYEMLSGDPPFQGGTPFSLVIKHIKEPPPSLIERRRDLSQPFQDVIFKGLAKEPDDRFADAHTMRDALVALRLEGGDIPPSLITGEMIRSAPVERIPSRGTGELIPARASDPPHRPSSAEAVQRATGDVIRSSGVGRIPERGTSSHRAAVPSEPTRPSMPVARRPASPAVVHNSSAPPAAIDDEPAVLEDRPGHYTRLVTRQKKRPERDMTRLLLIAIAVLVAIGLIVTGVVLIFSEPGPTEASEAGRSVFTEVTRWT